MTIKDACLVLGIKESDLSDESLKHAFYNAAHLSHPDNNPQNAYADTKFAMIQEAYMILKGYIFEFGCNTAQEKYQDDPWDAYNEADIKFAKMKQEETMHKMKSAFEQHERAQKTERIKPSKTKIYEPVIMVTKHSFADKLKRMYLLFLESDILFDCILAGCIAIMIVLEAFSLDFQIMGWMVSLLLSRHVAKLAYKAKKNELVSVLLLLAFTELFIEIMKMFLI